MLWLLPFSFLSPAQLVMYPLLLAALHVFFTPFRLNRYRMSRHFNSCTPNTRQLLFSAVPCLLQEHAHAEYQAIYHINVTNTLSVKMFLKPVVTHSSKS